MEELMVNAAAQYGANIVVIRSDPTFYNTSILTHLFGRSIVHATTSMGRGKFGKDPRGDHITGDIVNCVHIHQENPGLAYALWELKMSFLP